MKWVYCLAAFLGLFAAITAAEEEFCFKQVVEYCNSEKQQTVNCTATFSGFPTRVNHLQSYANHQIEKSFDFLLLATNFGTYMKNRLGFEKQFRSLSDTAWNDGINLIKKIAQRGGSHDFKHKYAMQPIQDTKSLVLDEADSMAYALDVEKELAREAHNIHHMYSFSGHPKTSAGLKGQIEMNTPLSGSVNERSHYDPEITFYLEEHFLEKQAEIIRKLAGYTNDLTRFLKNDNDKSLALYLFDEYLKSA